MSNTYVITTMNGTAKIVANTVSEALKAACIPATTELEFENWISTFSGYGSIKENGSVIAFICS